MILRYFFCLLFCGFYSIQAYAQEDYEVLRYDRVLNLSVGNSGLDIDPAFAKVLVNKAGGSEDTGKILEGVIKIVSSNTQETGEGPCEMKTIDISLPDGLYLALCRPQGAWSLYIESNDNCGDNISGFTSGGDSVMPLDTQTLRITSWCKGTKNFGPDNWRRVSAEIWVSKEEPQTDFSFYVDIKARTPGPGMGKQQTRSNEQTVFIPEGWILNRTTPYSLQILETNNLSLGEDVVEIAPDYKSVFLKVICHSSSTLFGPGNWRNTRFTLNCEKIE